MTLHTNPTEVCNCWNCRYLIPQMKDMIVQLVVELDEVTANNIDMGLYHHAQELLEGKVRRQPVDT